MSVVSIIKYTKTHIHKTHDLYAKKIPYIFPFTSGFKYHKASLKFSICTKHSLKLNTNAPLLPKSPTKTVILYSSKVTGAEVLLFSMLELSSQRASRFWKEKTPMATRKHCTLQQSQRNLICPTYHSLQCRNYLTTF